MIERKVSNSRQRIAELLTHFSITQADMSKRTGISKATICRFCNGEREPRQSSIAKIADSYNIDPAWLMGFDVPMKRVTPNALDQRQVDELTVGGSSYLWQYVTKLMQISNENQKTVCEVIDAFYNKKTL